MDLRQMRKSDDALVDRLISERGSWDEHWKDLADHFLPRSQRFSTGDRNKGGKKNSKLLNGSPARAARILSAGMFSSITNQARPWFNFTLEDDDLASYQPVRMWLDDCTNVVRGILASSNYYKCAPSMFRDLGVFGTHAQLIDEDGTGSGIRCYPFPCGSYYLSNNADLMVDLVVRRFSMTVRQLIERFGKNKLPAEIQTMANNDQTEAWCDDVIHICGPNPEYDPGKLESRFKRYASRYYLMREQAGKYLRIAGYDEFPIVAPRWEATGEDAYGSSPAMLALPDARSLMVYERRVAQAIEKKLNPPMKGPLELEDKGINPIPGSTVFSANPDKIGSLYDLNAFQVADANAIRREKEAAVDSTMYVDLFLMLANSDRRQVTAEEIRAKQEEKILALGEPLERLNDEALGPGLERTFNIADRQGKLPPPPPELVQYQRAHGNAKTIKIEYVSSLHQVMRMVKLGQIDRAIQFLGSLTAALPETLDNFDGDEAFLEYAESLGLPPRIIRSPEKRDARRKARAQAQQQQAAMQQAAAVVQGAQVMSQTDTGGTNALTDLMRQQSGAV